MRGAIHVLAKGHQARKLAMADVALVAASVPARRRDSLSGLAGRRVSEEFLGDEVVGVAALDFLVDSGVVEASGFGTGGGFEVGGQTGRCGEVAGAEGAGQGSTAVGFAVEVQETQKVLARAL